jgi:hypothetical protein
LFGWLESNQANANSHVPAKPRAFQLAVSQAVNRKESDAMDQDIQASPAAPRQKRDLREKLSIAAENVTSRTERSSRSERPSRSEKLSSGSDLRNLLNSKRRNQSPPGRIVQIEDRASRPGPERSERRHERSSPYARPEREQRQKPITKCSFYPNCGRPECTFFHPTEPCPEGEACTKGSACLYIHEPKVDQTQCKYRENCTNPACTFAHPSPAAIALAKASTGSQPVCRYSPNCLNPACLFLHPNPQNAAPPNESGVPAPTIPLPTSLNPSNIVCRFDPYCSRYGCFYLHPSKASAANNTNHTSERSFAVGQEGVLTSMVPQSLQMQLD